MLNPDPNPNHELVWITHGRTATCESDPQYPDGMEVDCGQRPACAVTVPYPAPCCGVWLVQCSKCGVRIGVTAAGRTDDVRKIMVPCKGVHNA